MSNDNSLRDKLAEEFALIKFPVQNIETSKNFTQDVNFARRMSHHSAFQAGWDAARANAGQVVDEKLWLERDNLRAEVGRLLRESEEDLHNWERDCGERDRLKRVVELLKELNRTDEDSPQYGVIETEIAELERGE